MWFIYDFAELLGFFSFMLLFLAIAVIAKNATCHIIGSALTLLSLLGLSGKEVDGNNYIAEWIVFVVLLMVGFLWIEKRKTNENEKNILKPDDKSQDTAIDIKTGKDISKDSSTKTQEFGSQEWSLGAWIALIVCIGIVIGAILILVLFL